MSRTPTTEAELTAWLVGESELTRSLRRTILTLAPKDLPVWIEGETGVGKEQVATALHAASGRRGPLVSVNVCAIAETMFEDAFFGHKRGAFTGAGRETTGFLGEADGGTLFLDEISGLSVSAQAKLLRAVETGRYRQVGGSADRVSRFRLITASNESADALCRSDRLRRDLAYRLRGAVLLVPSLRERNADILALTELFLAANDTGDATRVSEEGLAWLLTQRWRGNVRELRQVLHCARAHSRGGCLSLAELRNASQLLAIGRDPSIAASMGGSEERDAMLELLMSCEWDTARAATALGVDRTTVYRRMRRLGITVPKMGRRKSDDRWAPNWRQLGANPGPHPS